MIRVISMETARRLYRATQLEEDSTGEITLEELEGLESASTFERFLLWNRKQIEVLDLNYEALLEGIK